MRGRLDMVRLGRPDHDSRREADSSAFPLIVPSISFHLTGQRVTYLPSFLRTAEA